MIKKVLLIVMVIMMFTGCSRTISYKYGDAVSKNGDWSVENGRISIKKGDDSVKFDVKYIGDTLIEQGESWSCSVMVCKENTESSIDNAEVIFSRNDIYAKEIAEDDIKAVETDNDVISIDNDYDFSTIFLYVEYTKEKEEYEDIIELSLK